MQPSSRFAYSYTIMKVVQGVAKTINAFNYFRISSQILFVTIVRNYLYGWELLILLNSKFFEQFHLVMADGDISRWCQFPELAPHIDQWMLSLHSILGSIVYLKSNVTIGPIFVCMVNIPMPYEKQSLSNAQYSIFGTWYPIFF